MADVFRTLILPAAQRARGRDVSAALYPDGGVDMYVAQLSATGNAPATHYVSSGYLSTTLADYLPVQEWVWLDADPTAPPPGRWVKVKDEPGTPARAVQDAVKAGTQVTLAQMNALFAAADISTQQPGDALARLGLEIVRAEIAA